VSQNYSGLRVLILISYFRTETIEETIPTIVDGVTGWVTITTVTTITIPPITTSDIELFSFIWLGGDIIFTVTPSVEIPPFILTASDIPAAILTSTSGSSTYSAIVPWLYTFSPGLLPTSGTINTITTPAGSPTSIAASSGYPGPVCKSGCGTDCSNILELIFGGCIEFPGVNIPCVGVCGCIGGHCPDGLGDCLFCEGGGSGQGGGDGDNDNNEPSCTSTITTSVCDVYCIDVSCTTSCITSVLECQGTGATATTNSYATATDWFATAEAPLPPAAGDQSVLQAYAFSLVSSHLSSASSTTQTPTSTPSPGPTCYITGYTEVLNDYSAVEGFLVGYDNNGELTTFSGPIAAAAIESGVWTPLEPFTTGLANEISVRILSNGRRLHGTGMLTAH